MEVEIKFKNPGLIMILLDCLVYILPAIGIIIYSKEFTGFLSVMIFILGLLITVFFTYSLYVILIRKFGTKPGLVFNENGFQDNSGYLGSKFINWAEVKDIKTIKVLNQNFLSVQLVNPPVYINNHNGFNKLFMNLNYKMYGSPVHISQNNLKIDFEKLHSEFINHWRKTAR